MREAWESFESSMDGEPFVISALIDGRAFAETMIDTGCLSNGLCDPRFARRHGLTRLKIEPRQVTGVDGKLTDETDEVVAIKLDLEGHIQEKVFLYVAPIGDYDIILGMPWIRAQDVRINGPRSEMKIMATGIVVRSKTAFQEIEETVNKAVQVSATSFKHIQIRRKGRGPRQEARKETRVFAASMADINKALAVKHYTDPKTKMPAYFHD